MSGYLKLSLGILGNLWLSVAIYLWLSWVISDYLGVPQDKWSMLEYIGLYLPISGYLWLSLAVAKLSSSRLVQPSSAELRFALILIITPTTHPPIPRESSFEPLLDYLGS